MSIRVRTALLTIVALAAFTSNSLLTRLTLGQRQVDAALFTSIRLASGALVLVLVVRAQAGTFTPLRGDRIGEPLALFAYALPFSFAYLCIGAAVGALVLFGAVQLTMIGYAVLRGERPAAPTWVGVGLATAGLLLLTLPSVTRPDPLGLVLMVVAGAAWGAYSLAGRTARDPIAVNAHAFLVSGVLAIAVNLLLRTPLAASGRGVALALLSGGVTTGLGYAAWYRALPGLSVTQAAVAQLTVPIIAALGATVLLDERLSARLVASGAAILGGLGLVLLERSRSRAS